MALAGRMSVTVEVRGAGDAQLRAVVRAGLPALVGWLARQGRSLPGFVAREFEAYLGCGDPANGVA